MDAEPHPAPVGSLAAFAVPNFRRFGAVIASLVALNVSQLHPSAPVRRGRGQLRQGLAYARAVPEILAPPAMMARATIIGAIGDASSRLALLAGAAACGAAAITGFALLAHARAMSGRIARPGSV